MIAGGEDYTVASKDDGSVVDLGNGCALKAQPDSTEKSIGLRSSIQRVDQIQFIGGYEVGA